eukprot:scaffold7025_cov123-Cylindrotheca_fusiformis.AAC.14
MSKPSDFSTGDSNNGMSHHSSSHGGDTPEPEEYIAPDVAIREEKAVTRSKILVVFVLLLAVCGAAAATYIVMEDEQGDDFASGVSCQEDHQSQLYASFLSSYYNPTMHWQSQFAGLASEVSTVSWQKIDQIFTALDAYSLFIASEVEADANSSWPFVVISDYSQKSEKISRLLGLDSPWLVLSILVQEDLKEKWTSFAMESAPGWYQNSLDNEGNKFTVDQLMSVTVPFLHEYNYTDNFKPIPTQTSGPVLPQWQKYPIALDDTGLPGTNYDMLAIAEVADLFQ